MSLDVWGSLLNSSGGLTSAVARWVDKLYACAAVGHQAIDLYEDDFLHYMSLQPGANLDNLWEVS